MSNLPTCMYVKPCIPGACGGQKRVSDPTKLELQIALSCHVAAGNKTQ